MNKLEKTFDYVSNFAWNQLESKCDLTEEEKEFIEETINILYESNGLNHKKQTLIGDIFEQIEITINSVSFRNNQENIDALIQITDDKTRKKTSSNMIALSNENSFNYNRYLMVYELGHYIFDFDPKASKLPWAHVYYKDMNKDVLMERRADYFALAMIMGKEMFSDWFNQLLEKEADNDNRLMILAAKFQADINQVERRIKDLNLIK